MSVENRMFKSVNPYTQSEIAEHIILSNSELEKKLKLTETAYKYWRNTSFEERAEKMKKVAKLLLAKKEGLGLLITNEMGKILPEAIAEVEKSAGNCDFYAEKAEEILKEIYYDTPFKSMSVFDPMGAVLGIMPWNYPFWQVFRYVAPVIMSGNVALLKHAPNVIGSAKAIEDVFLEAGFPEGVFQQLSIDVLQIERVIASDVVSGVTFTGSEMAGASVAHLAGKYIKKSVLELGGSDAFVVLDDANLEKAATIAAQSRMLNAGQACICAKRFIVTPKIADEFAFIFTNKIKALRQGNPLQEGIHLGPLARIDLADKLSLHLKSSLKQGAKLILGGEREFCNFQPTILDNVDSSMVVFKEETFGPLATIIRANDDNDAIALANNHRYGLAASIWTEDRDKAFLLARKIEAGNVFVNSLVRSDSRIPFGGIKKSGFGRELSEVGIKEFMNQKSVVIE